MKNNKSKFAFSLVITIFLTLGLSISFQSLLADWVAPTLAPPAGNTNPPIFNEHNDPENFALVNMDLGVGGNFSVLNGYIIASGTSKVGIGTTTPNSPLVIQSTADALLRLYQTGGGYNYISFYDDTSPRRAWMGMGSNGNDFYISPAFGNTIFPSGKVGIGTSTPAQPLQVNGTYGIGIGPNGGVVWPVLRRESASGGLYIDSYNGSTYTTNVTFKSNGNVGIGTTSPQYKLDIWNGKARIIGGQDQVHLLLEEISAFPTSPPDIIFRRASGTIYSLLPIGAGTSLGAIDFRGYYAGSGYQSFAQIVGKAVDVSNKRGGIEFKTASSTPSVDPITRMVIDYTGNVGIGTTNPLFKLDINGGIGTALRIAGGGDIQIDPQNSGSPAKLYNDSGTIIANPDICTTAGKCLNNMINVGIAIYSCGGTLSTNATWTHTVSQCICDGMFVCASLCSAAACNICNFVNQQSGPVTENCTLIGHLAQ